MIETIKKFLNKKIIFERKALMSRIKKELDTAFYEYSKMSKEEKDKALLTLSSRFGYETKEIEKARLFIRGQFNNKE